MGSPTYYSMTDSNKVNLVSITMRDKKVVPLSTVTH